MAETYVAGAISKLLGGELATSKKSSDDDHLTALFSPSQSSPKKGLRKSKNIEKYSKVSDLGNEDLTITKKKKKRKKPELIDELEEQYEIKKARIPDAEKNTPSKTPDKSSEKGKKEFPRPRRDRKKRNPDQDNRTVFVGNLSIDVDKKKVKKLFQKYGEVESIRFRSAAPSDLTLPKKAIVIMKSFHEQRHNLNGYVVFTDKNAAKEALQENGTELEGLHIRVDLVTKTTEHKHSHSIFIGNLPFDAEEEPIRGHFADCGDIENVRIIRDRVTQLGKGFGYVLFSDKASVELAMKLNGKSLLNRKLRVSRSSKNPSGNNKDRTKKTTQKTQQGKSGKVKVNRTDGKLNESKKKFDKKSFQGIKATKGEKIKKPKQKPKQFVKKSAHKDGKKKQSRKIPSSKIGAMNRISKKIKKKASSKN